jgi:hypothetical protein
MPSSMSATPRRCTAGCRSASSTSTLARRRSATTCNRGGQTIDVAGLPCLFDTQGPCANAVKDAQRTKTTPATQRVLAIVWGVQVPDAGHAQATAAWLRELFERLGAQVAVVPEG